jgi:predicted phosphate transport protein (TIGR00153 family)
MMFSGEAEIQARRKTLAVLQDEVRRVLDACRELTTVYLSLLNDDDKTVEESLERIKKCEEDTEGLRRLLIRELAEIGTMMMNREDFLRTAYTVEEMAGYVSGVAFKFSQIKPQSLKKAKLENDLRELIDMAVESVQRLNEVVRALGINPIHSIDLAQSVQKIERQIDEKYRNLTSRLIKEVDSFKDLILLKDIIQGVEDLVDLCLEASDSITILALGL